MRRPLTLLFNNRIVFIFFCTTYLKPFQTYHQHMLIWSAPIEEYAIDYQGPVNALPDSRAVLVKEHRVQTTAQATGAV